MINDQWLLDLGARQYNNNFYLGNIVLRWSPVREGWIISLNYNEGNLFEITELTEKENVLLLLAALKIPIPRKPTLAEQLHAGAKVRLRCDFELIIQKDNQYTWGHPKSRWAWYPDGRFDQKREDWRDIVAVVATAEELANGAK